MTPPCTCTRIDGHQGASWITSDLGEFDCRADARVFVRDAATDHPDTAIGGSKSPCSLDGLTAHAADALGEHRPLGRVDHPTKLM